jgi:hypothetical protein
MITRRAWFGFEVEHYLTDNATAPWEYSDSDLTDVTAPPLGPLGHDLGVGSEVLDMFLIRTTAYRHWVQAP